MKYYKQMRDIEDQIIRLDTVESMLRILGESESNGNDMMHVVWHLTDIVDDINVNLSEKFYKLSEELRKIPEDNDLEVNDELFSIVNSWVQPKES